MLSPAEVQEHCASPRFRDGAFYPSAATVDPARLAAGLRERLLAAGVEIYENTPLRAGRRRDGAGVRPEDARRVAPRGARDPRDGRLAAATCRSSVTRSPPPPRHMVVTEPVPELIEEIGWTGNECITDSRAMIHYFRTTFDGRIAFGWGGGEIIRGARVKRGRAEIDPAMARQVEAHMRSFFPGLEGKRVEHAWGGPIDVSPTHLPSSARSATAPSPATDTPATASAPRR